LAQPSDDGLNTVSVDDLDALRADPQSDAAIL
jgi:hypothetical protein